MKGFKKGIALIAVLAFLITAILPVSGLAAAASDGARIYTVTFNVTPGTPISETWDMTGYNLGATATNPAGRYVLSGTPSLADAAITVGAADAEGTQTIVLTVPNSPFTEADADQTYTYGFCFQGTNWPTPGNAIINVAFRVEPGSGPSTTPSFAAAAAAAGSLTAVYSQNGNAAYPAAVSADNPTWSYQLPSGSAQSIAASSVDPANGTSTLTVSDLEIAVGPISTDAPVTVVAALRPNASGQSREGTDPEASPSESASAAPSESASAAPSESASAAPSAGASAGTSAAPSAGASAGTSAAPSAGASAGTSAAPSAGASAGTSAAPSSAPSAAPTPSVSEPTASTDPATGVLTVSWVVTVRAGSQPSPSASPSQSAKPTAQPIPDPFASWSGIDAYNPATGLATEVQRAEQWEGSATLTLKDGYDWDTDKMPNGVTVNGKTLTVLPSAFGDAPYVTVYLKDGTAITIWKGVKTPLTGEVDFSIDNPFTYWTQPTNGLFGLDEYNKANPGFPTQPVDTQNGHLQIGPQAYERGAAEPNALNVNERVQIYVNPKNIVVGSTHLNNDNWQDNVTMQWQYKPSQSGEDDGNARDIPAGLGFSGVRSPLLTISPLTAAMDGWQVRLVVWRNDTQQYKASKWIELDIDGVDASVVPVVTIASYPEAAGSMINVPVSADVTLTASVQNYLQDSAISYEWQSQAPVTAENPNPAWVPVAGGTSSVLTVPAVTQAMSGTSYRCQAVNNTGSISVIGTSDALKLNVTAPDGSVIISDPTADVLYQFVEGRTLTTAVTARTDNGDPVSYAWFVKAYQGPIPTGDKAIDTVAEAAAYTAAGAFVPVEGATGPSMTSAPLTEGVYVFRCRVQNADNAAKAEFSRPVYVVVSSLGSIVVSPAAGETTSVGVLNGKAVTLAPVITGPVSGVSYRWQISENGGMTWADLTATTPSLTLPALTTTATNSMYRLVISSGSSTINSGSYLLNVWDTANTPVITKSPLSQSTTYSALANGTAQINDLTSTATISQQTGITTGSGFESNVSVIWYENTPDGPRKVTGGSYELPKPTPTPSAAAPTASASEDTQPSASASATASASASATASVSASPKPTPTPWTDYVSGNEPVWTATITQDPNSPNTYTSTLHLASPSIPSKEWAQKVNGSYFCVWFKQQTGSEVCELTQAAKTPQLLAPQAASYPASISISVAGNPQVVSQNDCPVTVHVGESATFWVNAVLNPNPGDKLPTYLVYTWQKSVNYNPAAVDPDNTATWTNVLTTEGIGQFTNRYTTAPVTQQQYDENYNPWFRVIIANRATGAKLVTEPCHLVITEGTPQAPVLMPGTDSPITIEGTAPDRYATGVTVSADGTTADKFLEDLNMTVPAGYSLQIVGADGEALSGSDLVYTGCVLQLVNDSTDEVADSATLIVRGDVLGASNTGKVGTLAINQLVRMAQDLNETRPLEGIYEMAGDFNGNGSIDIADLVAEAQLLSLDEPVQK